MVARKTSNVPTKIYTYGCLPPDAGTKDLIFDQLHKQVTYRNALVAIELKRRTDFRELRKRVCPELSEIEQQISDLVAKYEALRLELSAVKRKDRGKHPLSAQRAEVGKQLREMKIPLKQVRERFSNDLKQADDYAKEQIKALCQGAGPRIVQQVKQRVLNEMLESDQWSQIWKEKTKIEMQAHAASLHARRSCGLFCGNYQFVEQAFAQSKSTATTDPGTVPFRCRGKIGIQIIGGVTLSELTGGQDPRIHLDATTPCKQTTYRKRGGKTGTIKLRLGIERNADRLGSVGNVLTLPVLVHRPLPEDSKVTWAWIRIDKSGQRVTYKLQFSLESETFREPLERKPGTVAINLGYRKLPDGSVRVGCTWDGEKSQQFVLPAEHMTREYLVQSLRSVGDNEFNKARNVLKERLAITPEWVQARCETIAHWRAHGKLLWIARDLVEESLGALAPELFERWSASRLGDRETRRNYWLQRRAHFSRIKRGLPSKGLPKLPMDLFASFEELAEFGRQHGAQSELAQLAWYLYAWAHKDRHLDTWASNLSRSLAANRRQIYRNWTRTLKRQYGSVIIEDWDMSKTSKLPAAHRDTRTEQEVNSGTTRQLVGISSFAEAIRSVYVSCCTEGDAKNITAPHIDCGVPSLDSPVVQIPLLCQRCGCYFDQDLNAAKHLFTRHSSSTDKIAAE